MNQRVVTVTLNPAIDLTCSVDHVVPERKLRCSSPKREPGGGGINVARALSRLGSDVLALWSSGGAQGDALRRLLELEAVPNSQVPIQEETRENLTVYETASGQQYRFGMPGPCLQESEHQLWLERIRQLKPAPGYLVLSGSLPPGTPSDFFAQLVRAAPVDCKVVLDTSGDALAKTLAAGVYLVKPNLRELCQLTGRELIGDEDVELAAGELVRSGAAKLVAASLGRGGAVLVSESATYRVTAPAVRVKSTVGAGDSMVAGLVSGLASGLDPREALILGVAAGTAATMRAGTGLCRPSDIELLRRQLARPSMVDQLARPSLFDQLVRPSQSDPELR